MKAWVHHAHRGPLTLDEVADPDPGPAGLVIAVDCCGLCHSDLHRWTGTSDHGSRGVITRPLPPRPIAMGHEIVGHIVACGPEVANRSVGEKVIVYPWFGCGTCKACLAGEDNLCAGPSRSLGFANHGGFAERVAVPHERYAVPLGDLDPARAAPLACAGLTARCAIRKIEPFDPSEKLLVIGAGGVGLTGVAVLSALGHRNIVVVDRDPARAEAVTAAGAQQFVVADPGLTAEALAETLGGKVGTVLDFVNSSATAALALGMLAKGGRMVQVGLYGGEIVIPLPLLTGSALTVQGSITGSLRDLEDVVDLARRGVLPETPRQTAAFETVNTSLEKLERGEVVGRLVLTSG